MVCYTLRCDILCGPEDGSVLTPKIAVSDRYISIGLDILTNIMLEIGGSKNQRVMTAGTRDSPTFTVFCALSEKKKSMYLGVYISEYTL